MIIYDGYGNKNTLLTGIDKSHQVSSILFDTQYMAHGAGFSGYPPNSMPCFVGAVSKGYKLLEVDVWFTKDNVPVGEHDDIINSHARNDDGSELTETIKITEHTYDELSQYDFGIRVSDDFKGTRLLKIEDLLYFCKKMNVCVLFDLKNNPTTEQLDVLYDMVINSGMKSRTIWFGANINYMTSKDTTLIYDVSSISTALSYQNKSSLMIFDTSSIDTLTKDFIADAHKKGILCYVWTVDNEDTAIELFERGIDYVCTNKLLNSSIQ